ncbi:MAG: type II secretion system protein GspG [Planctomycetota bacterium]
MSSSTPAFTPSPSGVGRLDVFEQERRGLFDGLSVPHSLSATVLAAVALVVYYAGIRGIEEGFNVPGTTHCRVIAGMLGNLSCHGGALGALLARIGGWANEPTSYHAGIWVLFWGWSAAVWAFFAGAICRIAAVKLAREEVIEVKEALRFGAQKWLPNVLSLVFVLVFAAFFLLFCNGTLAGWVGRIPYLGDVVLGLFFPLALLAAFLAVFVSALGLLGFNLAAAAIATESSDTFDGVSRAWNYVLARPWQVLLTLLATVMYLGLVIFFGQLFLRLSVSSLAIGQWGLGRKPRVVDVRDLSDAQRKERKIPAGMHYVLVPGKGDYLYNRVIGKRYRPREVSGEKEQILFAQGLEYALERYKEHVGEYPPSLSALAHAPAGAKGWAGPYLSSVELPKDRWGKPWEYVRDPKLQEGYKVRSPGPDGALDTPDDLQLVDLERELGPRGPELNVAPFIEGSLNFEAFAVKRWVDIARLLLFGYVVAYFFSAQTMVYFLLRKDVEGDDYTEVTLEDEVEDFEDDLHIVGGPVAATEGSAAKRPLPSAEAPPAKPAEPATKPAEPATKPAEASPAETASGEAPAGEDDEKKQEG